MSKRGEKVLAGGTWTEARFYQFIRTALRQASMRWPGKSQAKEHIRRPKELPGRHKWEYPCHYCNEWMPETRDGKHLGEMHHVVPVGKLKCLDDLPGFVARLFCEWDGFRFVCTDCHAQITAREKARKLAAELTPLTPSEEA